jgi:hypothetical protein
MGKAHGGLVHWVLVDSGDQEGTLTENTTQESVQEAIFKNIHQKQFFLEEAAPYALVISGEILDTTLSQKQQGPSSMEHTNFPLTLIKPQRKSVKNVLTSGK